MKVKELLHRLNQLDPELEVICYSEDSDLLSPKHLFRLLDVTGVSVIDGEKQRGDDGVPSFKLGKSSVSKKHAAIEVASDF